MVVDLYVHLVSDEPKTEKPSLFSRITPQAYAEGRAQSVEDELRLASIHAPSLIKAIRTNEALGYLDSKNLQTTILFDLLNAHFHLPYKYGNFAKYRR